MLKHTLHELKSFFLLWITQSFSALGSAMTNLALIIWLYQQSGSALTTAALSICSYAPYVLMSIFAGALSDKWNKKVTMLVCDSFAAACTVIVLLLLKTDTLAVWHLYVLNALNGLMNTIQQPASDVAVTLLTPKQHYQRTSGLRSFSNSLVTILTPALATTVLTLFGIDAVIAIDLLTFAVAFVVLLCLIRIPEPEAKEKQDESVLTAAKSGLVYLKTNPGILWLILFLAAINLIASIYNAALPAMLLSCARGGESVLGAVQTAMGIATLTGSLLVTLLPAPKSRIRVICNALLFSMSTENFMLAFGKSPWIWCLASVCGWIAIPLMSANMDVILRSSIPTQMQGRVYSARNTLQFFTIPIGYSLGGILVDRVFEPFMAQTAPDSLPAFFFGTGKGSGAAMLYCFIGFAGVAVCLLFRRNRHLRSLQ